MTEPDIGNLHVIDYYLHRAVISLTVSNLYAMEARPEARLHREQRLRAERKLLRSNPLSE